MGGTPLPPRRHRRMGVVGDEELTAGHPPPGRGRRGGRRRGPVRDRRHHPAQRRRRGRGPPRAGVGHPAPAGRQQGRRGAASSSTSATSGRWVSASRIRSAPSTGATPATCSTHLVAMLPEPRRGRAAPSWRRWPSWAGPTSASRPCSIASPARSGCWSVPVPGTTRDAIDAVVELDGTPYPDLRHGRDPAGLPGRRIAPSSTRCSGPGRPWPRRCRPAGHRRHRGCHPPGAASGRRDRRIGGRLIVVLNKWDATDEDQKADRGRRRRSTGLHRVGAGAADRRQDRSPDPAPRPGGPRPCSPRRAARIPTPELNRRLIAWQEAHPPPTRGGRRGQILYAVQAGTEPPTIILFVRGGDVGPDYLRFLEGRLREDYEFTGTPIRLIARRRRSEGAAVIERRATPRGQPTRARQGGPEKYRDRLPEQGKLPVRTRVDLLCDRGSFVEDGLLANVLADDLGADGVVTGRGLIDGRPVVVIANDPTVKAGSWGARTVEKMVRALEGRLRRSAPRVLSHRLRRGPDHRPGRAVSRPTGRRQASSTTRCGSPAGFRRSAASSDRRRPAGPTSRPSATWSIMVEGNASMYLGSPRMAEMVIGEHTTLEEMGGARMHCTVQRMRRRPGRR